MTHLKRTVLTSAAPAFTPPTSVQLTSYGFIVASPPSGGDDTVAMQASIDAGYAAKKPIWFPSGTYRISNTLRCYQWASTPPGGNGQTNEHQLFGASYPTRPIFRIANNATATTNFGNAAAPRPVIGFAKWRPTSVAHAPPNGSVTDTPTTVNDIPSSPYIAPSAEWTQAVSVLFESGFWNIDIDTRGMVGADGAFAAGAQGCFVGNTVVTCTNGTTHSRYGILGLPGRSSPAMNVTVVGGQIGVSTKAVYPSVAGAMAGAELAGVYLLDQTVHNIEVGDFVPLCVTGFHFRNPGVSAWTANGANQTAANGASLIDGIIEMTAGAGTAIAIDNTASQGVYGRNIYVTGTSNLWKNGTAATITGTNTWKRIDEVSGNAFSGTFVGIGGAQTNQLQHFAYIDGTQTWVQQHVATVTSNAGPPPTDIVFKHICAPPQIDSSTFIDITASPYNATNSTADSRVGIQAAIDAAATAGHNRVFVPSGSFKVSTPGITLGADTKIFGVGKGHSTIAPHTSWVPLSNTTPRVVQTVSSVNGTAQMAWITMPNVGWNVGRKSSTFIVDYNGGTASTFGLNRFVVGTNGGGRHYLMQISGSGHSFRGILGVGNTQPLHFYGWNSESAANFGSGTPPAESTYPDANAEFTNASNIRFFSCKREGPSPTVVITSCTNFGLFSSGGMRDALIGDATYTPTWESRFLKVMGACSGIIIANSFVQTFNEGTPTSVDFTLYEEVPGDGAGMSAHGILWPNGLSLFKRNAAAFDDSVMTFT